MDSVWITRTTPEPGEMVLVTCETETGVKSVKRAYIDENGVWHGSGSTSNVTAWQPLPKPYEKAYMVLDEHGFSIKHPGQWVKLPDGNYMCSECGFAPWYFRSPEEGEYKFCPRCGAKMERSEE